MYYIYHDWIIESGSYKKDGIIHIATRLKVEIRGKRIKSEDGYISDRLFVRLPSEEILQKFIKEAERIGFSSWVEISEAEYQKSFYHQGFELPSLNVTWPYPIIQGRNGATLENMGLKERWAEGTPTYVRFDWIPSAPVTQEFIENLLKVSDFCLGCATRIGHIDQAPNSMYVQRLLVRVLFPSELDGYQQRIQCMIDTVNWTTISKEAYEIADQVDSVVMTDFLERINQFAKANSDLQVSKK